MPTLFNSTLASLASTDVAVSEDGLFSVLTTGAIAVSYFANGAPQEVGRLKKAGAAALRAVGDTVRIQNTTSGTINLRVAQTSSAPVVEAVNYLISEDMEEVGTPTDWLDAGSPDWDYATSPAPLFGAQSLYLAGGGSPANKVTKTMPDNGYLELVARMSLPSAALPPAAQFTLGGFRTSAGATICLARILSDGKLAVYSGSDSTGTVEIPAADTPFWMKLVFERGGTVSIEWNYDGVWLGSGNRYTSKAEASGATVGEIDLRSGASGEHVIWDNLLVLDGVIANDPQV